MSPLQFIDQQQLHYPVQLLCQVLPVVPSRYYAWCQRAVNKAEPAWETAMVDVFDDHQRRYGTRRLQVELRELGHRVGRQALRTALRRHGRKALQLKAFTPRTTELLAQRPAPGLIVRSDRGGQYVGNSYKTLLRNAKAQLSHSRRGECYDSAQAEGLWARLKTELLEVRERPIFTDLADAQHNVATY